MTNRRQKLTTRQAYWEAYAHLQAAMGTDTAILRAQRRAEESRQELAQLMARCGISPKVPA